MDTKTIIETAEEHLIHTYNRYQIVLDNRLQQWQCNLEELLLAVCTIYHGSFVE